MATKMAGGYKVDEKGHRQWPAIRGVRRISKVRLDRLSMLLRLFCEGLSVQEIAEKTGMKKIRVYHEMYYLKKLGLLDPDFKNPKISVWAKDIAKEVAKNAEN